MSDNVVIATATRFLRSLAVFWVDGGKTRASGVLLQFRSRFFIATAAHAIARTKSKDSIRIVCHGSPISTRAANIVRLSGSAHPSDLEADPYDVGFIELEERFAAELGADWVHEHQLASGHMAPGSPAILVGSPQEFDNVKSGKTTITMANPIAYGTFLTHTEYDEILVVNSPRPENDLVLEFDPERCFDLTSQERSGWFEPHGMSGCGVFSPNVSNDGVWTAERASLCGIQSSLYRNNKLIVAKRIEILRDVIEEAIRNG